MTKLEKPKHDQLFRKALENPCVARELIEVHLQKNVLDIMDMNSLKLEKESFVEADLTNSVSDVLFSAKFNENDGYVYLLLEHQSTQDRFMAFRLFKYMINICDRYRQTNPNTKQLPLIYPLVIYMESRRSIMYLVIYGIYLATKFLQKNSGRMTTNSLIFMKFLTKNSKKRIWSGILEFFMKHIHERQVLKRWQEIAYLLAELTKVTIGYDYIKMIRWNWRKCC